MLIQNSHSPVQSQLLTWQEFASVKRTTLAKNDSGHLTYAKTLSHKHIGQHHFHASVFQTSNSSITQKCIQAFKGS